MLRAAQIKDEQKATLRGTKSKLKDIADEEAKLLKYALRLQACFRGFQARKFYQKRSKWRKCRRLTIFCQRECICFGKKLSKKLSKLKKRM